MKIRKDFNIRVNIAKISEFIGCNPKGIYYIENNFETNKTVRYLMYLRKKGVNINKILDVALESEKVELDPFDD